MILLGLGSNLSSRYGDRFKNIDIALSTIEKHEIRVIKKSSYFESFSYPNKKDPKFINVVVQVESLILPEKLASILLSVEESLDRKRNKKNDPRTCDIDIIDYNNQVLDFKHKNLILTVPHKKLIFRNFVLFPLAEIFSEWKHPVTKENVSTLIDKLSEEDKKSILKIEEN